MGGKGGTKINQPPPIDPGKAQGEYLFGTKFRSDYNGVTDPRLQERIIGAEEMFRPRYAALELADIQTFAQGLEGGDVANQQYVASERRVADLEADLAGTPQQITKTETYGSNFGKNNKKTRTYKVANPQYARLQSQLETERGRLSEMEPTVYREKQGGLFDLLEESGRRASELQRESLGLQRADDVQALQDLAPQVVQAYRDADPQSARLADLAAGQAETAFARASGPMGFEAQRQVDQSVLGKLGGTAFSQQGRSALQAALGREQYQQGREQFAAGLGQGAFGQSRQLAGDLGAAILGRPSQGLALGGQVLGQAQAQAGGPMGPQLFDPNVGINMAMQQRSDNISLLGAQAQADASRSSGAMSAMGSIAGAAIGLCWVAREVYGVTNPKWKQFREWMLNDSPSWFRKLYIKHGEKFAKFISDKPRIKAIIRKWMNTRIK
tara:strand:+ start:5597 stop:6919 length:1323 start_codon:yes stop_codon:yes gene_type:complete